MHRMPHLQVVPVEVGLSAGERGEEILPATLVEGPRTADGREGAEPVVGRSAARRWIGPYVPGSSRAAPVALCFEKPRMLGRAVVQNQVQNDAHAVPMRGIEQPVEICQRPIDRIDRGEVGDVIAEIDLGRWKERRQPEGVDLQRGGGAIIQIIETNGDTRQVADSVAIRIGKAAWVDLVEDRRSPPSGGTLSQQGASLSGDAATSL